LSAYPRELIHIYCCACLQRLRPAAPHQRRGGAAFVVLAVQHAHADYQAKAGDSAVLQRPIKCELLPEEILSVFGYPRNLKDR
jgi:hypothetical protein